MWCGELPGEKLLIILTLQMLKFLKILWMPISLFIVSLMKNSYVPLSPKINGVYYNCPVVGSLDSYHLYRHTLLALKEIVFRQVHHSLTIGKEGYPFCCNVRQNRCGHHPFPIVHKHLHAVPIQQQTQTQFLC